jgi:hypothetical protein
MKRIKLAIIGVVCLSLFIYMQACSDNNTIEQVPKLEIPEEFNEVGILHNEGLEYIYEEIKTQAIEYTKNPKLKSDVFMANYDEFLKQTTIKFCKQNNKLNKNIDACEHVVAKLPLKLKSEAINYDPAIQSLLNEINVVFSKNLTEDRKEEEEIALLKIQLDVINRKATETLSETDAAIIFCATSTGYHSYQYWTKNYQKWYFALHYPEILEQYNDDELNQLQLKNGQIKTKGWWSDLWNTVERWFAGAEQNIRNWWNSGGKQIVYEDFMGAVSGAYEGFQFGGNVWTVAGGAAAYGFFSSAAAAW